MLVRLTKDADGRYDGYTIEREEGDDLETIERIRDMHFWGSVKYDGREVEEGKDDTKKLKFKVKRIGI